MTETAHTPLPDAYLFANEWGEQELLLSCHGEQAQRLLEHGWTCSELFTRADSHHRLVEALEDARTELSITRTNIMCEINRCADPRDSRWEGVPEILKDRIAKIDAALKEARHADQ